MTTRRRLWLGVVVVALAFAGFLTWAFVAPGSGVRRQTSPTVHRLLTSPGDYYGRPVVVTGSVDGVYNGHAITLGTPLAPGLLVTGDLRALAAARLHAIVRVTGVAARFSLSTWRRRTGGHTDLGVLATFDGKPVIQARHVVRVGPGGLKHSRTNPAEPRLQTAPAR